MPSIAEAARRALADITRVDRLPGVFVQQDGVRGIVDVGGGRIPADLAGYLPEPNESVWVLFVGGTATILGPAVLKPGDGTIAAAPSGNMVAVDTVVGQFLLPYAAGLTLSVGQKVKLGAWNNGGFVFAVKSSTPPPPPPPDPPIAVVKAQYTAKARTLTFTAKDSGSYRSGDGWWQNELWASDNNSGAWFYGTKVADTIPNGATIQSVQIYTSVQQVLYADPLFGYHGSSSKPGGFPTLMGLTSKHPINNGWVSLPTSWGDYLKSTAGGIGITQNAGTGFTILRSVEEDGSSGALRIKAVW